MANVSIIYQPHFLTDCVRVACDKQLGEDWNYVIICCSPSKNGVYKWDANKRFEYDIWLNGKTACYCVPMNDLIYVKPLTDIQKDKPGYGKVVKMQKEWWKGEIKNGRAHKIDKYPSYFLS